MADSFDKKQRGDLRYERVFKNRGRVSSHRSNRRYEGNATSTGVERSAKRGWESPGTYFARCGERQAHRDIEKHHVVDYAPQLALEDKRAHVGRKNNLAFVVSNDAEKGSGNVNTNVANESLLRAPSKHDLRFTWYRTQKAVEERPLRLVHLPEIAPRLFLGDSSVWLHTDELCKLGIRTVITVGMASTYKCYRSRLDVRCVAFNDDPKMSWHAFGSALRTAIATIDDASAAENEDEADAKADAKADAAELPFDFVGDKKEKEKGGVAVICERGINRSVAVVAAYATAQHGWSFADAVSYIDSVKLVRDKTWNSLTNPRVRNYLRAFMQQLRQQQQSARVMISDRAHTDVVVRMCRCLG